jgi:hypothetical protein
MLPPGPLLALLAVALSRSCAGAASLPGDEPAPLAVDTVEHLFVDEHCPGPPGAGTYFMEP